MDEKWTQALHRASLLTATSGQSVWKLDRWHFISDPLWSCSVSDSTRFHQVSIDWCDFEDPRWEKRDVWLPPWSEYSRSSGVSVEWRLVQFEPSEFWGIRWTLALEPEHQKIQLYVDMISHRVSLRHFIGQVDHRTDVQSHQHFYNSWIIDVIHGFVHREDCKVRFHVELNLEVALLNNPWRCSWEQRDRKSNENYFKKTHEEELKLYLLCCTIHCYINPETHMVCSRSWANSRWCKYVSQINLMTYFLVFFQAKKLTGRSAPAW